MHWLPDVDKYIHITLNQRYKKTNKPKMNAYTSSDNRSRQYKYTAPRLGCSGCCAVADILDRSNRISFNENRSACLPLFHLQALALCKK